MDQNQILRLLATLREECAAIRGRQEELFELLVSYKDQLHDLKTTVVDKLAGLPRSPYIAGQLVPAPDKLDGVDDFRQALATYLHKHDGSAPDPSERPADLVWEKPPEVKPEDIELEPDETERPRRHREGGGGGGGRRGPRDARDNDLQRGPERDVEAFDLHEDEGEAEGDEGDEGGDEGDDGEKPVGGRRRGGRRRRRGGRGRRRDGEGGGEGGGERSAPAPAGDAPG